jgi:hypothetical protein
MTLPTGKAWIAIWLVFAALFVASAGPFVATVSGQDPFPPPATTAAVASAAATPDPDKAGINVGLIRLPLAAALGMILALRPRHRGAKKRNSMVVQTQIMLAVVGAVIMIIVGESLGRGFAIAGAANLIRYRSTIDDPKEAVVMLCALAAGLAAGVGYYQFAPFATVFMAALLWVVEYFEPTARKRWELEISMKDTTDFRPKVEGVLSGFSLDYELLAESEDELKYSISSPADVRTRDVSDTIKLLCAGEEMSIEWDEKKPKK